MGHTCVVCQTPIEDGVMRGFGDGAGDRFAHDSCYWRREAMSIRSQRDHYLALLKQWWQASREKGAYGRATPPDGVFELFEKED